MRGPDHRPLGRATQYTRAVVGWPSWSTSFQSRKNTKQNRSTIGKAIIAGRLGLALQLGDLQVETADLDERGALLVEDFDGFEQFIGRQLERRRQPRQLGG